MRIFELADVILLLRSEVKQAGGQTAWAKKNGINRTILEYGSQGSPSAK
jgi:hypothetical protein